MFDLKIVHHFSGGVYAKQMTLQKGYVMGTHKHKFDHMSVLVSGSASVETDGQQHTYEAGSVIEIKANIEHRITALEDITWLCIHATNETGPENIDETLINE